MSNNKPATISNLIAALEIFKKYGDVTYPTHCEHDVMYVGIAYDDVSVEDKAELAALGFNECGDLGIFQSFTYGSA